ncbi:unnamed protein product [Hymenolepis diminuta]|uniref:Male-enhanced antigen 1 n=1 Tax=Hymenolepis diminuta TaxID=6216 RepID=A0A0R3S856_HYMDI|nr:unnamed protein product [Hymenolepis diminuta]VUZ57468.1 unnamed protein product [Hymenolepis diminuta]VUZ57469.1 unnamed protein product [Hymenolepis diminuta]
MRDTAISNGQGSTPSSPTGFQDDAFSVLDGQPAPSSPEHVGYTLLENGFVSSQSSDEDEEEEMESGSGRQDSNTDPLDDARIDETLRRVLNSDGTHFGSFQASEEPEDEPDESSPALLWNEPRKDEDQRIPLSDEKATEIKAYLSGFKLPEAYLPTWAMQIPEEVWKQRLLQRISSQSAAAAPTSKSSRFFSEL